MTLEQILQDIRSDRVKKVILDSDMGIEMDDQYALAYCIGSPKVELLSVNAATFGKGQTGDYIAGMEASYQEILRVLNVCGCSDRYPAYRGATRAISDTDGLIPVDSEAVQNIIRTSHESTEILYILATGCCTNITSAFLLDPSIRENTCVIWLGGQCLDYPEGRCGECNLEMDYRAGQLLLNLDIPLILLPAHEHGTSHLEIVQRELDAYLPDENRVCQFFRKELPDQFRHEKYYVNGEWGRILYDVAAPAVLNVPDAFEFRIIPAPVFGDDGHYALDASRRRIIYMETLNREQVLEDTFRNIRRAGDAAAL